MVGTLDDFDGPLAFAFKRMPQLGTAKKWRGKGWKRRIDCRVAHGSIKVLNGSVVHNKADQEAVGVGRDVSLAALHLLAHCREAMRKRPASPPLRFFG